MQKFNQFTEVKMEELHYISGGRNKAAYKFGKIVGKTVRAIVWPAVTGLLKK